MSATPLHTALPGPLARRAPQASWGDKQITRCAKRITLFVQRGWDSARAERWAERLTWRDAEGDDRRLCIECAHLRQDRSCFAAAQGWVPGASRRLQPVTDVLARCACFEWAMA